VALQIPDFQGSTVEDDVGLDVRIFQDSQPYDSGIRISLDPLTLWCDSSCTSWSEIYGICIPWISGGSEIPGISGNALCSSRLARSGGPNGPKWFGWAWHPRKPMFSITVTPQFSYANFVLKGISWSISTLLRISILDLWCISSSEAFSIMLASEERLAWGPFRFTFRKSCTFSKFRILGIRAWPTVALMGIWIRLTSALTIIWHADPAFEVHCGWNVRNRKLLGFRSIMTWWSYDGLPSNHWRPAGSGHPPL